MSQPLVLVTGSSGLIGRAAVERLAGIYDVVGLSRTPTEGAPGDFVELDVTLDDSRNQPGWLPDGFVLVNADYMKVANSIQTVDLAYDGPGGYLHIWQTRASAEQLGDMDPIRLGQPIEGTEWNANPLPRPRSDGPEWSSAARVSRMAAQSPWTVTWTTRACAAYWSPWPCAAVEGRTSATPVRAALSPDVVRME